MVPYPEIILHIVNVGRLSLDKCLTIARDLVSEDLEEEVDIIELIHDTKDEKDVKEELTLYMRGMTTQGPILTHMKGGSIHIDIPYLSTPWDISMCFAICKAIKQMKPECIVILNDNTDHEFSLIDQNKATMFNLCTENMEALLKGCKKGNSVGVVGLNKEFYFSPDYLKEKCKGMRKEQKIIKLFQMFLDLQWNYNEYDTEKQMQVSDPGDDEPYAVRILSNDSNYFIGNCHKLVLMNSKGDSKLVLADDFHEHVKDNKHIIYVDDRQFVIHKMSKKEWDNLVKNAPGEFLPNYNTYIMRWNPAISSMTMESYKEGLEKYPDGFGTDWSIHDYKKAKEGDSFYMVRVGEGKTGVIWKGELSSGPYEDDDWAGDPKKKRKYVKLDIFNYSDPDGEPFITTEELQKAIPDFDWEKGHSGELLTEEQAYALDKLWYEKVGKKLDSLT